MLSVMLASAIRIAQSLNIHRLGPDPEIPISNQGTLQREIEKSVWMFLRTQDWLLIPFNNAYSISPRHCTTPRPIHCSGISGLAPGREPFESISLEQPTLMSYQLIMFEGKYIICDFATRQSTNLPFQVAVVFRSFYDQTSEFEINIDDGQTLRKLYDCVLDADARLEAVSKNLPRYLRLGETSTSGQLPCYIPRQRFHLAISIAHKVSDISSRFASPIQPSLLCLKHDHRH
jgi:hypothetical protein